ncbi:hypothetical protein TRFO_12020 [Tritrichomonas foetus]|uniref:Uncharacterized protein n=1 Tax=Tritrichomonas foetus TaxID=1144522 RepID=A0A1J4J7K9_9EUKA|nr:hypothetical protein TRFO_12020 [Tritrichomonas foetus]|eukprot:OHS93196.1 hypothetical protein TRFO_12020 [Tritrichomonas foetus]
MILVLFFIPPTFSLYCINQSKSLMKLEYPNGNNGESICINITKKYTSTVFEGSRQIELQFKTKKRFSAFPNFAMDFGTETGVLVIKPKKSENTLVIYMNTFEDLCDTRLISNDPFLNVTTDSKKMTCLFYANSNHGQINLSNNVPIKVSTLNGVQYLAPTINDVPHSITSPAYIRSSDVFNVSAEKENASMMFTVNGKRDHSDISAKILSIGTNEPDDLFTMVKIEQKLFKLAIIAVFLTLLRIFMTASPKELKTEDSFSLI